MNVVVVGGGSWGSAFSALLRDSEHDVTLACRDSEQARTIADTGRNPRYLKTADLRGIAAVPLAEAPFERTELVVLAVPSRAFAEVAASLPGSAPVLSLTKGLDPASGCRLGCAAARLPSSPARTWRRRSPRAFRPQQSSRATSPSSRKSSSTR